MSHEIRTPMNAVLGMLQLVQQTELSRRQLDYISKAQGASQSLLALLNDILDYSKFEAGKLQLAPHAFELEALMRDLAVILAGNLGGKPVEVLFDLVSSLPERVNGDRLRLQQVIINLAGNALKFTARGEVIIRLSEQRRDAGSLQLGVAVTDTGIGIAEEQLPHIFDGFSQAEASTTRRFGGSGLGLAISRRLVELLGGELRVQSRLGAGSCFSFEIPLGIDLSSHHRPLPRIAEVALRVLVVDDNAVAADILARALDAKGWSVTVVDSGTAALSAMAKDEAYDLILMDWLMPGMDGLETARRIRALDGDPCPTIIMVTALGREQLDSLQDEVAPNIDAVLTKPVTPKQLVETIQQAHEEAAVRLEELTEEVQNLNFAAANRILRRLLEET